MTPQDIAEQLQEVYGITPLPDVGKFLIDESCVKKIVGEKGLVSQTRELMLISHDGDTMEAALYLAPQVLGSIASGKPYDSTLDAFCAAVEGISHLCCVLWKFSNGVPTTHLELEIQAEIDKFICCALYGNGDVLSPVPLHHKLFSTYSLSDGKTPAEEHRYHFASYLASRFCWIVAIRLILGNRIGELHRCLRAFYRMNHWQKLRTLTA